MIEIDIKNEKYFKILGSMALKEDGLKRMFLKDIKTLENINDRAGRLAYNNAGMQVRFSSNTTKIKIKVVLKHRSNMSNMSSLGQSGVDLYIYNQKLNKYIFQKSTPYEQHLTEYEFDLYENDKGTMDY